LFLRQLAIFSILVIIAGCSSIGCIAGCTAIPLESKNHETTRSLNGAWILFMDDEDTEKISPHEKIIFHKDGQILIDGLSRFCGKYSIVGDQIHIIVPINGLEIVYPRKFYIDENGLYLKNLRTGFVHYKRVKEMLEYCTIVAEWKSATMGYFTFKAPGAWIAKNKLYKEVGIQELQLINADASKILIMIRIPALIKNIDKSLTQAIKKMANTILAKNPTATAQLKSIPVSNLYRIKGPAYQAEASQPIHMTFQAVGKQMRGSTIMILFYYTHDRLQELDYIAQSIFFERESVSSQYDI